MKITQYDDLYTQKLGAGETTLVSGSSGGSNSAFGGDVVGSAGSLSVVGLRQTVSLSSNLAPSAAVGNVLTLISVGGTPVAQFAVPSNSGSASFGSNATRVSASSFVGASTNSAREDHRHDGIGTVTASSSNTLDRGTLNLRAGSNVSFGLTDSDGSGGLDTLTINSTATAAGGGGGTSGALILVEQHPASNSASLDFTTAITSTYDEYVIEILELVGVSAAALQVECSTTGGSSWDTTAANYRWSDFVFSSAGSTVGGANPGLIQVYPHSGRNIATTLPMSGTYRLYHPLSTASRTTIQGIGMGGDSATADQTQQTITAGAYIVATAVNALRFLMSSGNISSGTIRMYGVAK